MVRINLCLVEKGRQGLKQILANSWIRWDDLSRQRGTHRGYKMKYKVGDLVEPTERMQGFGFSKAAIVIGIYAGRYTLAFPDGSIQVFHPTHLKPDKK